MLRPLKTSLAEDISLSLICFVFISLIMDNTLNHHGFHVERRKMYPFNPRNNLRSSVDFVWQECLSTNLPKIGDLKRSQKQQQRKQFEEKYNTLIDNEIYKHNSLDKSSYRVMGAPFFKDALDQQKLTFISQTNKNVAGISTKTSLNVSKLVFGYDIRSLQQSHNDGQFKKTINRKLQPFLTKQSYSVGKHQSISINHPINLKY